MMNKTGRWIVLFMGAISLAGCHSEAPPKYGAEMPLSWPGKRRQVWAVAPAVNLSGQNPVDPLLQGDLVYQQLQQVEGITAIPVNRVVEVYASLRIDKVQSEEQAALICDLLGCDGLIVPTVTAFDPYDPPKVGVAIQLFAPRGIISRPAAVDIRELARSAAPKPDDSMSPGNFLQVVGMFDGANGTVRDGVEAFARGRSDPSGPLGSKEYFVNMDRYCSFAYHSLIAELISQAGR